MGDTIIQSHRIGGTCSVVFSAWEPRRDHSTITTNPDGPGFIGRIGTDPDHSTFDHLPVGDARSEAVQAAYSSRYSAAYAAILAANPYLSDDPSMIQDMGEIRIESPDSPLTIPAAKASDLI